MRFTKYFNFKKPEPFDTVNINDLNDSFDLIDNKLKETVDENKNLLTMFKNLIINAGNSNAEVAASRGKFDLLPTRLNNFDSSLEHINIEKVSEVLVDKKINQAKLEAGLVDTTSLVFRNDLDNELLNAQKILDINYVRGTIYGYGSFSDDAKYFRSKNALLFTSDTSSKIYVKNGFQIIIWRWSDLSQNALDAVALTQDSDFIFKKNCYYHFVLKRINTTETMLDDEKNNIKIITFPNYYFKVGINENKTKINSLEKTTSSLIDSLKTGNKKLEIAFARGTIAGAGVFYDSVKHYRSSSYLKYSENKKINISIPSGFSLIFWCYNTEYSQGVNSISAVSVITNTTIELQANKYYYLLLKKDGDNEFTVEEDVLNKLIISEEVDFDYKKSEKKLIEKIEELKNSDMITIYGDKEKELINKVFKEINENSIVFGLVTDTHAGIPYWDNLFNHQYILNKLCEKLPTDFIMNLGDSFTDVDDRAVNFERLYTVLKNTYSSQIPNLYTKGNHEVYPKSDGGIALQDWQINGLTGKSNKWLVKNSSKLYYHVDIRGIRVIVLDSSENTNNGYSQEQVNFLHDALESASGKAIIFTHIPPSANMMLQAEPINGNLIRAEFETYKDKVLFVFNGHTHWDNECIINGVKYISTCCSMCGKLDVSAYNYQGLGTPTTYDRTYNTYSEYCMDICVIDTFNNTFKSFRFGAGNDRVITK